MTIRGFGRRRRHGTEDENGHGEGEVLKQEEVLDEKKLVDKGHLKVGDRAGVVGKKLPSGEWMANAVILGLPAPAALGPKAGEHKKEEGHKH